VARNDDDRQIRIRPLHDRQNFEAVETAALQPDVENDKVRFSILDGAQRFVAVAREACAVAFILQDTGDQIPDIGFIIDDQYVS
jgi:hypothetical protein